MSKTKQYSPEVKERAVRLVREARKDDPSRWAAVESIAPKIGCAGATLHEWVKRHGLADEKPRETQCETLYTFRCPAVLCADGGSSC